MSHKTVSNFYVTRCIQDVSFNCSDKQRRNEAHSINENKISFHSTYTNCQLIVLVQKFFMVLLMINTSAVLDFFLAGLDIQSIVFISITGFRGTVSACSAFH